MCLRRASTLRLRAAAALRSPLRVASRRGMSTASAPPSPPPPPPPSSPPARVSGWVTAFWVLMGASATYNVAKFQALADRSKEYRIGALFGLDGKLNASRAWLTVHNALMCATTAAGVAIGLSRSARLAQKLKWPMVALQTLNVPLVLAHHNHLGDRPAAFATAVNGGGLVTSNAALAYWVAVARAAPTAASLRVAIGVYNTAGALEFLWIAGKLRETRAKPNK